MKRSEINKLIRDAIAFFDRHQFKLPPFAYWTPQDWKGIGEEAAEIRDNMLGWDITDFGSGQFKQTGLFLFTLRNGNPSEKQKYPKTYAEKIMIVREEQITPYHFHWQKMEDIINRGGGNLILRLYPSTEDGRLGDGEMVVHLDGVTRTIMAGDTVELQPGESITLLPYQYHSFWAEKGNGPVLTGEVSHVNDDNQDNRFLDPLQRFSDIEEDEAPLHYLVSDYTKL